MKRVYLLMTMILLAVAACGGTATVPEATLAAPAASATNRPPDPTAAPSPTREPATATAAPTDTAEPTETAEPTLAPTATATAEPSPEPSATAVPATEAPPPPAAAAVVIDDFMFSPGGLTVRTGSTVTWTHTGRARHTVTADDGSFDSGSLSGGGTFSVTFDAAGTYAYYCRLHGGPGQEGMSAVITVTDN